MKKTPPKQHWLAIALALACSADAVAGEMNQVRAENETERRQKTGKVLKNTAKVDPHQLSLQAVSPLRRVYIPESPLVYQITNVSGEYTNESSHFILPLRAQQAGQAAKVRIAYDFDGSGYFERVEMFHHFPADEEWLSINDSSFNGRDDNRTYGEYRGMENGLIRFEIWLTHGQGSIDFDTETASLRVPFALTSHDNATDLHFVAGAAPKQASNLSLYPQTGGFDTIRA